MWFSGPSFETPAEIRAARSARRRLVGMSTVPEVILARRAGLRCAAVSVVTNFAAGLAGGDPSHEETQEVARRRPPTSSSACCAASSALARPERHDACRRKSSAPNATGATLERRRDRRVHRRPHRRRGHRGPGRRLRHGGVLPRHEPRRARRADPRDDALGRDARLARGELCRPGPRQAFDRRRRRQRVADAGADAGRLRRLRADDLRPRPRPYRRHARQARFDSRLRLPARPRALPARGGGGRLRDHRPDGRSRARRPAPLRHPRRDRDGRIGRADHRLDPVEEARRRASGPGHGRQDRLRRLHADARGLARARAKASRPSPPAPACRPSR